MKPSCRQFITAEFFRIARPVTPSGYRSAKCLLSKRAFVSVVAFAASELRVQSLHSKLMMKIIIFQLQIKNDETASDFRCA